MHPTAIAPSPSSAVELAFTSADEMPECTELPVRGELPSWLAGQLLRNGPGRWKFDSAEVSHWFDGMALLHSFEIDSGRVHYRNRFVESSAYQSFRDSGELKFSEFASDPCRTRFQRIQSIFRPQITDNPAVSTFKFGEQFIALSETPMAWEFDGKTLETIGVAYENPGTIATAHPHAGERGELLNLSTKFGARSSQSFFRLAPGEQKSHQIAKLVRRRPTYQHSFGLSERWLVLTEFPFSVDPLEIIRSGRPFIENFRFRPEEGTRITLIDRQSGEIGGEWEAEPGFCFHHANAWEEGDDVVVDLCRFDDPSIVEALYLDQLRASRGSGAPVPYLHRYRLRPGQKLAEENRVSEEPIELPRINYGAVNGQGYNYAYGIGFGGEQPYERLVKIDAKSGASIAWQESGNLCGEPVFVPAPDARAEDDGVILSLVLDGSRGASMLLVLDASDMSELARAEISVAVPPGFHGSFARTQP